MKDDDLVFRLATNGERGTFVLSQEGLDLVRCLLLKWIMQAEKGETSARELAGDKTDTYAANQAAYFRNAASFLLARLTSHLTARVNIREQLAVLTRWLSEEGPPPRWEPLIGHAEQLESDDALNRTPLRRRGTDRVGTHGRPEMVSGQPGKVDSPERKPSPPDHNPPEGGKKDRPNARRKGSRGTRPDH